MSNENKEKDLKTTTTAGRLERVVMATDVEIEDHCERYPCGTCPITKTCRVFYALFGEAGGEI